MADTKHAKQLRLDDSTTRNTETLVSLVASKGGINLEPNVLAKFLKQSNNTVLPANYVLTATPTVVSQPLPTPVTYKWSYALDNAPDTWTTISTGTTNTLTVTNTAFTGYLTGTATSVTFKVEISKPGFLPSERQYAIYYEKETDRVVNATISNPNVLLFVNTDGTISSFPNSGCEIRVTVDGKALPFNSVANTASTFNIDTITQDPASGVTLASPTTPTTDLNVRIFGNITAMSQDTVTVSFPIIVRNEFGTERTATTLKQQFTKAKSGTSLIAELTNDYHAVPTKSDGTDGVFTGASTTLEVYLNGVKQSSGYKYYVNSLTGGVTYKDNNDGNVNRTGVGNGTVGGNTDGLIDSFPVSVTGMTDDAGTLEITAKSETNSNIVLTKIFSLAKNKAGIVGNDAIIYYVTASTNTISKAAIDVATDGAHTPDQVVFTPYKVVGNAVAAIPTTTDNVYYTTWTTPGSEPSTRTQVNGAAYTHTLTNSSDISAINYKLYSAQTGGITLDSETVPVSFSGPKGTDGATFSINVDGDFTRDKVGTVSPDFVTITVNRANLTGNIIWSAVVTGSATAVALSTSSSSQTAVGSGAVSNTTVYLLKGQMGTNSAVTVTAQCGVFTDKVTIYQGKDGEDTISARNSNEVHEVTANADGTVKSYTGSGTTISLYHGAKSLSCVSPNTATLTNGTFKITGSTVDPSGKITVGTRPTVSPFNVIPAHSGMDSATDTVSITYNLSYKTDTGVEDTATTTQTINKRKDVPGVTISSTASTFAYDKDGLNPVPSSTTDQTVTATAVNTGSNAAYRFLKGGSQVQAKSTTNTYTYRPQANFTNMPETITVELYESATATVVLASASISMSATKTGATGTGTTGTKYATIKAYKWSTATASTAADIALPTNTFTYTWSTSDFGTYKTSGGVDATGLDNGWSKNAPAATADGQWLWEISKTIQDTTGTASTTTGVSFANANYAQIGYRKDGVSVTGDTVKTATTYLYYQLGVADANKGDIPTPVTATASATAPYNFNTGVITLSNATANTNWAQTPPAYTGGGTSAEYWYRQVNISQINENTQTVTLGDLKKGINFTSLVTFTNLSTPGQTQIDGGNIKTNTIIADKIDTKGLTIKDSSGRTVFSADYTKDYTGLDFTTKISSAVSDTDISIRGSTIEKVAKTGTGNSGWNNKVYSNNSFTGNAYVRFKHGTSGREYAIGLSRNPIITNNADLTYTNIDCSILVNTSDQWRPHLNGTAITGTSLRPINVGDILAIVYENSMIKFLENDVVKYEITQLRQEGSTTLFEDITSSMTFKFDSSFNTFSSGTGGKVVDLSFGRIDDFIVRADNIRANNLQAISADLGTITAGTIKSGTTGTTTSDNGIEITPNGIKVVVGGKTRVKIGNLSSL